MSFTTHWPKDIDRKVMLQYGYAVQIIAGADGELTFAERELFFADAKLRDIPEAVLSEWKQFDWRDGNIVELMVDLKPRLSEKLARLLIYDAIRMAGADATYPLEEQDAVRQAAAILGVSEKLVAELEILAALEKNVDDLRKVLFIS